MVWFVIVVLAVARHPRLRRAPFGVVLTVSERCRHEPVTAALPQYSPRGLCDARH
jgi:hypothetical protein